MCRYASKILIVGNWRWDIYEDALSAGFKKNDWSVIRFDVSKYLSKSFLEHFQSRIKCGPNITKLNKELMRTVIYTSPNAVFFNRCDLIYPRTLTIIKEIKDAVLILYHNDNPFINLRNKIKNRHFLASIPIADITLVYRPSNLRDAQRYGANKVSLFMPYYLTDRHKPLSDSALSHSFDVIFVGHYEPDGREEILNYLFENGITVRVFGSRWEKVQKKFRWLAAMDIHQVWGDEYRRLLSSAKIALVFFSNANRDVYSRRCFEITACGTMMLAPRTPELEQLFADGKEAVYFDSKEDLLQKTEYYLGSDEERSKIAQAGRKRCIEGGNDEISRTKELIEIIEEVRNST